MAIEIYAITILFVLYYAVQLMVRWKQSCMSLVKLLFNMKFKKKHLLSQKNTLSLSLSL